MAATDVTASVPVDSVRGRCMGYEPVPGGWLGVPSLRRYRTGRRRTGRRTEDVWLLDRSLLPAQIPWR